jgi:ATP-binding cassette subfamily F protein 3
MRIGFLPQRPELAGNHTLWEEQLRAFDDLRRMEFELARLEQAMADPTQHERALAEYGPLQERFEHLDGYNYENRIRMVLSGVAFADNTPCRWRSLRRARMPLARLLLDALICW